MPLYRVIILSEICCHFLPAHHINVANSAYFNSVMHNGLIFWGNTSHSANIFEIQKNIIRIITGYRSRASCRDFFKTLKILPLQSQYTLSLLLCAVNNKNITSAKLNQIYHYIKKGVFSTGINVFNSSKKVSKM